MAAITAIDIARESYLQMIKEAKHFSPAQEAELQAMQQVESDAIAATRIAEAEEPPNPMEGFADEAVNRIDQDLLMLESGIRTKALLQAAAGGRSALQEAAGGCRRLQAAGAGRSARGSEDSRQDS